MPYDGVTETPWQQLVVRRARDQLTRRGWGQGTCMNERGNVCALGAVYFALDETWDTRLGVTEEMGSRSKEVARYLGHPLLGENSLARWNDQPGRTVDDVLALFDAALAKVDA